MEFLLAGLTIVGSLILASIQHRPQQGRVSVRTSRKG
ncbi:hypothetical protein Deide_04802 [Deinococcus deserti VCD115]|uniref:Uncharacterized protein n=1 Tax=Deinococcus deserti (strain DSM 17065 / CIP 109153 / LMG 22923 / VCD115) TaxID=546414 RepID=X5H5L9_DEIDV|nr:hypothetical protein Deide_04802 [Deinococcus deserti VCD115]